MSQPDLSQVDQLVDLQDARVVDSNDEEVGSLEQIWVDNVNALPEWAAVRVGRGLRSQVRLVPLRAADFDDGQVRVNYTRDEVTGAPEIEPDRTGHEEMERLYRHYRQPLPAPPPPRVRNPFDRMTATWIPGVREKAASYAERFERPRSESAGRRRKNPPGP